MATIHMANGEVIEVKEDSNIVADHILKAKKANRPIIFLHIGEDQIWLNPDQINFAK